MLKYRRLSPEELNALEDEFVKFLAAQSITAPDWVKIKKENANKQNELIDLFSNIVMERVLSSIEYLEISTQDEIRVFKMEEERGRLVGLSFKNKGVNLTDDKLLNELFSNPKELLKHQPEVYTLEKKYTKTKAEECFFLVNLGATVTNRSIYDFIGSLLPGPESN